MPLTARRRHMLLAGKTGSGKSVCLANIVLQAARAGEGVSVLVPESEFVEEEVLPFLPSKRLDDLVYVNPADDRPVPFNPLHVEDGEDPDLKLDETLSVFHRLFAADGGGAAPRMEMIFREALAALLAIPGSTLLDVPRLLDRTDDSFRMWVVGQLASPERRHFWTSVYPAYPRDAHLSLLNRLGRFLQPKVVRRMLCPPGKCFSIRRAMDEGRIVVMNLSDGILGAQNASLIGQLLTAQYQIACMARADQPKEARRFHTLVIDEFPTFVSTSSTSYATILARARKYGLGLVLALQHTGQIPEGLLRDIFGNVGTDIVFRTGAGDGRRFARELTIGRGRFPHGELQQLGVGEAYLKLDRSVFRVQTLPPPEGGDPARARRFIERSRAQWGSEAGAGGERAEPGNGPSAIDLIDPSEVF